MSIDLSDLDFYKSEWSLAPSVAARVSDFFVIQAMWLEDSNLATPNQLCSAINQVEFPKEKNLALPTKPATKFKRGHLKGLWHKHFFNNHFLPGNFLAELKSGKLDSEFDEICKPYLGQVLEGDTLDSLSGKLAKLTTIKSFNQRRSRQALTGEWIIYAQHDGSNYYLGIGGHGINESEFIEKMVQFNEIRWPDIREMLA